jgi:prophage regulatory protein
MQKLLRFNEVVELTGWTRQNIYLKMNKGEFPTPIKIGGASVAWLSEELEEWLATMIEQTRQGNAQSKSQDSQTTFSS